MNLGGKRLNELSPYSLPLSRDLHRAFVFPIPATLVSVSLEVLVAKGEFAPGTQ